jgi:hypothetical protein
MLANNFREGSMGSDHVFSISTRKLISVMIAAIIVFGVLHESLTLHAVATDPTTLYPGQEHGFLRMFDLGTEANLPTWYQVITIAFAGFLLTIIASTKRSIGDKLTWFWMFMGAVFFFLSADEASGIHEALGSIMEKRMPTSGALSYGWIIPYVIFGLVFLAVVWKFLASLPPKFRMLFILSGIVYVSGAVGMEMVEGHFDSTVGQFTNLGVTLRLIEETLEPTGILLFNYSLLTYIREQLPQIFFRVNP